MKKLTSIVLLLCMLIGVFSLSASATTPEPIAIDAIDTAAAEAYWTDAKTGQFIVNSDATVYEIATAEQLLGLSLAMENNANDKLWTQGKTFKLIRDIDLNPGVDWEDYRDHKINGTAYTGVTPVNKWLSLDYFYGKFDGQGHTISGVWTLDASNGTASACAEWGVFGGKATNGSAVKNVVLDNGYVQSPAQSKSFAGIFAVAENTKGTNVANTREDGVMIENVYIGKNFVVDVSAVTAVTGGVLGVTSYGGTFGSSSEYALDVTLNNVVFAGTFVGHTTYKYDGCIMGQLYAGWMYDTKKVHNYTLMTNCLITGTYTNSNVDGTDSTNLFKANKGNNTNYFTATDCYDYGNGKAQSIPSGKEGKFIMTTSYGMLPVATADMFAKYSYQATTATDNKYSIRLIGEIASLNYKSVDFKVKITKADGKSAYWGYGVDGYINAETAYTSLIANNETVTPADLNEGIIDGENSRFYVLTLNDLDVNETYTITVSTVWTLTDDTVVESTSTKTLTPEPWVAE